MLTRFRALSYRTVTLAGLVVLSSMILYAAGWPLDRPLIAMAALMREMPSWLGLPLVIFIAASVSSTVGFAFSAIAAAMYEQLSALSDAELMRGGLSRANLAHDVRAACERSSKS